MRLVIIEITRDLARQMLRWGLWKIAPSAIASTTVAPVRVPQMCMPYEDRQWKLKGKEITHWSIQSHPCDGIRIDFWSASAYGAADDGLRGEGFTYSWQELDIQPGWFTCPPNPFREETP